MYPPIPNRASDAGPDDRTREFPRQWDDYAWEADEMIHSATHTQERGTKRAFLESAIKQLEKALEVL